MVSGAHLEGVAVQVRTGADNLLLICNKCVSRSSTTLRLFAGGSWIQYFLPLPGRVSGPCSEDCAGVRPPSSHRAARSRRDSLRTAGTAPPAGPVLLSDICWPHAEQWGLPRGQSRPPSQLGHKALPPLSWTLHKFKTPTGACVRAQDAPRPPRDRHCL